MTLDQLTSTEHPYYASDSNHYSNEAQESFNTVSEFLEEYKDADIDMNLAYRWDITKTKNKYSAQVVFIQQRKGIYFPVQIKSITEADVEQFIEFLKKHKQKLMEIWLPL
jgi:cystathionine beta-lyase family protein involved in aluminum resistance